MTGEEQFITAILTQAIVDTTYVGEVKDKVKFKMDAIDWIVGLHPEFVYYCKILTMDADTIRNKIIANLDMSFTDQQKFLIKDKGISIWEPQNLKNKNFPKNL